MTPSAGVLAFLGALPGVPLPGVASVFMPVDVDADAAPEVRPFGLDGFRGERAFRRALEVDVAPEGSAMPVRAMASGTIMTFEAGFRLNSKLNPPFQGTQTPGGKLYEAKQGGILLQVSPDAALARAAERVRKSLLGEGVALVVDPPHPLDLPMPHWIAYEGVELDEALVDEVPHMAMLDQLPLSFPGPAGPDNRDEPAETFDDLLDPPWGASALHAELLDKLVDVVRRLVEDQELRASIEGHTDEVGKELDNLPLSRRRAELVKRAIVAINESPEFPEFQDPTLEGRLKTKGFGEEQVLYDALDDSTVRGANRRVEVYLTKGRRKVAAGERIGTAAGTLAVTVLDERGRFMDPLDFVRRFDWTRAHADHPLAAHRKPLAPAIASGRVHCVSPPEPEPDGATPEETAEGAFLFPTVDPADPNPLQVIFEGDFEDGDVIWLTALESLDAELDITRPASLVTTVETVLQPADANRPTISITLAGAEDAAKELGVRILGVTFRGPTPTDGAPDVRSAEGGAALRIVDTPNVQISRCHFDANRSAADGGAVALERCAQVLVEDSMFTNNAGRDGGALFAADCGEVVIAGRRPDPDVSVEFTQLLADDAPLTDTPPPLQGWAYTTALHDNVASRFGGAVAVRRSRFWLAHCHFLGNEAVDGCGGAVAAMLDEPGLAQARRKVIEDPANPEWPTAIPNRIVRCVALQNVAAAGGGFAVVGPETTRTRLVGGSPSEALLPPTYDHGGVGLIAENIVHGHGVTADPPPDVSRVVQLGGGLHLMAGVFQLLRNRISDNTVLACGGGVSLVGTCLARLEDNRILRNRAQAYSLYADGTSPMEVGTRGGGGLYARWFVGAHQTHVELVGNRFIENRVRSVEIAGAGGAVYGAGGSLVRVLEGNRFIRNEAENGGGIAARNADLDILGDNVFEANQAQTDGGAIACVGVSMFARPGPGEAALETASDLAFPRSVMEGLGELKPAGTCATGGASLQITDSNSGRTSFQDNRAARLGGAIFVGQEPVQPLFFDVFVATDAPVWIIADPAGADRGSVLSALHSAVGAMTPNLTVGFVKLVRIEGASFLDDGAAGSGGSTIALQDLGSEWVGTATEDFIPVEKWLHIMDQVLALPPGTLGETLHTLQDLTMRGRGNDVSVLLIRSPRATPATPEGRVLVDVDVARSENAEFGEDYYAPIESSTVLDIE